MFLSTNTSEHYDSIQTFISTLLHGDTQSVLEVIVPSLFHAQTVTVQKLDISGAAEPLLQYINSVAALNSSQTFSKLSTPLPLPSNNLFMVSDALDTVVSEEEEDEEVIDVPQPEDSEAAVEIPLTQLEIAKHDEELKVPDESNSESLEVIPVDKESESIDEYRLLRPSGQMAYLFATQLGILQEIGKAVRSEDLLTYEHSVTPNLALSL